MGAIIPGRANPAAAVAYSRTPFVGQDALPVIQMLNEVLQRRTGLSDAAKGLDPKALQSSTMIGVDAIISGAQERIELVARVLASWFAESVSGSLQNLQEIQSHPPFFASLSPFQRLVKATH